MPTTRPRHHVTETDEVARALDLAAAYWPGETRSALVLRLIDAGARTLAARQDEEDRRRHDAVLSSSGAYTDAFPAGYLDTLRDEWPR